MCCEELWDYLFGEDLSLKNEPMNIPLPNLVSQYEAIKSRSDPDHPVIKVDIERETPFPIHTDGDEFPSEDVDSAWNDSVTTLDNEFIFIDKTL